MVNKKITSTICDEDVQFFDQPYSIWWNKDGPFKPLHTHVDIFIPKLRDVLIKDGFIHEHLAHSSSFLRGQKVLDVGCGGGILTEAMLKNGGEVIGIDPVRSVIQIAEKHAALDVTLKNYKFYESTIEEFSMSSRESFDVVVASEVLEHVASHDLFIEHCSKAVKPGGYLFLSTFNKTWISRLVGIWLSEYIAKVIPKGCHDYSKFISPANLSAILRKHNCKTIDIQGQYFNLTTAKWTARSTNVHYFLAAKKMS